MTTLSHEEAVELLDPERAYTELKGYQDLGLIAYVLPTDPIGEEWVIGQPEWATPPGEPAGLMKLSHPALIGYLAGVSNALQFLMHKGVIPHIEIPHG